MQHKILKKILEFKKKKKKKKEKKGQDGNQHLRLPEIPSQLKKFQQNFFNQVKHNNTLKQLHKSKQN